jgi:hypothetical protein
MIKDVIMREIGSDGAEKLAARQRLEFTLCSMIYGPVHPPPFHPQHRLSDWPDCRLELHCCGGTVLHPVRLLLTKRGDLAFADILPRLRCARCGKKPAPVYLCAGHRTHCSGGPPDWAIELVPEPGSQ